MSNKVLVIQERSSNRTDKSVKATLKSLGLGRIGNKRIHALTPSTKGMLRAVEHLITLVEVK